MKTKPKTTRKRVYPILQQIVQYLPCWTLEKLANKHRIDARSFSATSHVVALMVAHLAHTSSLNETCDVCAMHEKKLRYVRNVTPPRRNTLSNADRGYVDFGFLFGLELKQAFFVTRQRGPLKYEVKESREVSGDVISDEVVVLTGDETREKYTKPLRRIFAVVELNGQKHDMVFLTNNHDWAADTICELYRARWNIEVFFKELNSRNCWQNL